MLVAMMLVICLVKKSLGNEFGSMFVNSFGDKFGSRLSNMFGNGC